MQCLYIVFTHGGNGLSMGFFTYLQVRAYPGLGGTCFGGAPDADRIMAGQNHTPLPYSSTPARRYAITPAFHHSFAAFLSSPSPPMLFIRSMRGRNMAMTMLPTTTARKTIMMGSSREVMAATALSTSSS